MTTTNERGELRPWVIAAVAVGIMLMQLGVTAWSKNSVERAGSDAVARTIRVHDTDPDAHNNLTLLNAIDGRQRQALQDIAALKAVQDEQERRMDRIQKDMRAK